ncbi:ABC transporter ATP-binding protein [Rhodococcus sp. JS3073]|uniref:ABC transporter ATP-binding protein n=1 Tax=Rhodococcus sp. JS3073 TaxID=3002901 RepID=UPI000BB100F7|nr:ATP-binding cassette domain-containing protein [Rhodococcus sp. JS3073]PBC51564.1 ABC transporter ATP-binding protein [Rhodococcus sp. ACPA1]WAM19053.1 ATP-binding cassette domain-containing protein [Rhodococcus sp. JS3073]
MPDLVVEGCTKRFVGAGKQMVTAVNDLSLSVDRGVVVGILGSNGAGKSSLLSLIAGTSLPECGKIYARGTDITYSPSWKRVHVVARVRQNPEHNMLSPLTIEDNFALAVARRERRFRLRRAGGAQIRAKAAELLEPLGMGLENRLSTVTGTLSGGQRQAVAITMASIGDPAVLLLDEHLAALDPNSARKVSDITEELVRSKNITTLMVTHDMNHALERADRLLMMHEGRILLDFDKEKMVGLTPRDLHMQFANLAGESLPDSTLLS